MARITTLAGKTLCLHDLSQDDDFIYFQFLPEQESVFLTCHSGLSLGLCLAMCQLGKSFLNTILSPQQAFLKPPMFCFFFLPFFLFLEISH